jgi:hypothetical protein
MECRDSRRALLRFIEHWKPDIRIHVGDAFDLPGLRRGVSSEDSEAFDDLESDILRGCLFLEETAPHVLLLGNHDHRLVRLRESHSKPLVRFAAQGLYERIEKQCRHTKTKILPYHYHDGVYRLADGHLSFVHGYNAGINAVSLTATHFALGSENHPSSVIMGHLHRVEKIMGKRWGGVRGYSIGCLADFSRMDYAAHRLATAGWENAFAYGVCKGPSHQVWVATKTGSKWLLPTGLEEL